MKILNAAVGLRKRIIADPSLHTGNGCSTTASRAVAYAGTVTEKHRQELPDDQHAQHDQLIQPEIQATPLPDDHTVSHLLLLCFKAVGFLFII